METLASETTVELAGFLFGATCISLENPDSLKETLEYPLTTMFRASCYGFLTALGAKYVAGNMPTSARPVVPVVLAISMLYAGCKLARTYMAPKSE